MKKVLFASTALVALSLAGAAQAADPIALKLGGYSKWLVGYADNDSDTGLDYQDVDVKGTNEVFFLGSTTLDNGLKVGFDVQLEAGGQRDAASNSATGNNVPANGTSNFIDEAYITVDGGFGRVILGAENNAAYLLHVSAPDAAAHLENPEVSLMAGNWIANDVGASLDFESAADEDGDSEKITYMLPSFAGFTAGVSYTPGTDSIQGHIQTPILEGAALTDLVAVGASYNNSFGGVGLKLSAGYQTAMDESVAIDDFDEWTVGLQVGFAGFTVGGSYNDITVENAAGAAIGADGRTWTAGVQYATGPFAVSFAYMDSEGEGLVGGGEDSGEVYQFSGKYNMGPGVDAVATIGHAEFEDEGGLENDGWVAFGGLALAF